jgi:hypothetical protein
VNAAGLARSTILIGWVLSLGWKLGGRTMREAEITQMPAVKREAEEGLAQAMSVVNPETERSATPRGEPVPDVLRAEVVSKALLSWIVAKGHRYCIDRAQQVFVD